MKSTYDPFHWQRHIERCTKRPMSAIKQGLASGKSVEKVSVLGFRVEAAEGMLGCLGMTWYEKDVFGGTARKAVSRRSYLRTMSAVRKPAVSCAHPLCTVCLIFPHTLLCSSFLLFPRSSSLTRLPPTEETIDCVEEHTGILRAEKYQGTQIPKERRGHHASSNARQGRRHGQGRVPGGRTTNFFSNARTYPSPRNAHVHTRPRTRHRARGIL